MIVEDLTINEVSQPIEQDLSEILFLINKFNDEYGWELSEESKLSYARGLFDINQSPEIINEKQVYYFVTESDYVRSLANVNDHSYEQTWQKTCIDMTRFVFSQYKYSNDFINEEDLEDVIQSALLQASCNLKLYSYNSAFSTWLFVLVSRKFLQFLKYSQAQKRYGQSHSISIDNQEIEAEWTGIGLVEEGIDSKQLLILIRDILKKENPRGLEIIERSIFLDHTLIEISKQLHMHPSSVRLIKSRTLQRLSKDPRLIEYLQDMRSL